MPLIANAPHNLGNLIFAAAERNRDRMAIATMDESVTHAQLRDLVLSFAAHLRHHRIGRGACVALKIDHPIVGIALTIACSLVGASWTAATQPAATCTDLRLTHLLHDGAPPAEFPGRHLQVDASWARPPANARTAGFDGYASPGDAWMIAQSSGTTGTPKFMAVDEMMCRQRARQVVDPTLPPNTVCVCLFHPLSVPGILHTLRFLTAAGTMVFADLLDVFGRVKVDCIFGSPDHFRRLLDLAPPAARRIPLAIVAAAPAGKPFFAGMLRYFEVVCFIYASTEGTVAAAHRVTDAASLPEQISVGRPLPEVEIRVVTEDGTELLPGQEGIIKLRAPGQVTGYIGEPELTTQLFREGWFYPGDLGFLSEAGELTVTGRVSEQLNVGGGKINPSVIEATMLAAPGIRDAACFTQPDPNGVDQLEAIIAIAGPMTPATAAQALMQHLSARYGGAFTPKRIYLLPEIPRNPNGKIERHKLVDAVSGHQAINLPTMA